MTQDQFEHLRRMSTEPSYGVGYRAGLCGTLPPRCANSHLEPVAMADGWRVGLTKAIETRARLQAR